MKTLRDKRHLFEAKIQTFTPNEEGAVSVTEAQLDIQTSVKEEMEWISGIFAKWYDASYQVDVANLAAKADVLLEDQTTPLLTGMPTTYLLQFEKRVNELQELVATIPTLDPAKGFQSDVSHKTAGVSKARDTKKNRTKKVFTPLVLALATKEHPAQVKEGYEDKVIGTILEQEWSSLITPALKAELMDRCDKLLRAVKKARAVANKAEVDTETTKVGKKVLDYVFEPLMRV